MADRTIAPHTTRWGVHVSSIVVLAASAGSCQPFA